MYQLALLGPVFYDSMPLVAYRMIQESVSQIGWRFGVWVHIFELIEDRYKESADAKFAWKAFCLAFASKRRAYAKILMGAGRTVEARGQLRRSLGETGAPESLVKSLAMLGATYLPKAMQPVWLPSHRVWNGADGTSAPPPQQGQENG